MKHRHRILRITRYQLIQLIRNPRLYMIVICNFIFLSTLMSSLRTFLEMHQLKATPFLFSFLFIHPSVIFCFLAGVALPIWWLCCSAMHRFLTAPKCF